jgi:hypothetical protein
MSILHLQTRYRRTGNPDKDGGAYSETDFLTSGPVAKFNLADQDAIF